MKIKVAFYIVCLILSAVFICGGISGLRIGGNNTLPLILLCCGFLMLIIPVSLEGRATKKKIQKAESIALEKFGTTKIKDDDICVVCHKPYKLHSYLYECPNNAFYNYKTGKCEMRMGEHYDD